METIKKHITETITGNYNKPVIDPKNKAFMKAFEMTRDALQVWKWLNRNDKDLNESIKKAKELYNKSL